MLRYLGGVLVVLALCGVIWFGNPAKEQVKKLEGQISQQYIFANFILRDTVEELLEWDFNLPLTEGDNIYFSEISNEILYITDLIFSGDVVHHEWRNRLNDIQGYLNNYEYGFSLSNEDVNDLHQALQATFFISMDFGHSEGIYDAMHDEEHEMVEKVKSRLATQY